MTAALPVRVLVKGASTVNWTSYMGGPRSDLAFARVMEKGLLEAGRPSTFAVYSEPSELTSWVLSSWQEQVLGYSPDVIVLVFGHYESLHYVLPRWLERHANSLRGRPRRLALAYRRFLLRPVWKQLAKIQRFLDRIGPTTIRRRDRNVKADLRTYIEQVQKVGSPVVYLFELLPPHGRAAQWFPGAGERMAVINQALSDLVAEVARPNVRYFTVSDLVDELYDGDVAQAIPDGFHYTPAMHAAIGRKLAADVDRWAADQDFLTVRPRP